jgi:hypothetical protein
LGDGVPGPLPGFARTMSQVGCIRGPRTRSEHRKAEETRRARRADVDGMVRLTHCMGFVVAGRLFLIGEC